MKCLDTRARLSLLFPLTCARERVSSNQVQHHSSNRHSRRYRSCKRESHLHSSKESVAEKKTQYVLGAMLLFLAFSLATLDVNPTSTKPTARASGSASLVGSPSFGYASEWSSYGGPMTPNGVAVDSSSNVYVADAKNYAIDKLARDGSFLTAWGSQGNGPGHFNQGVALDSSGNVYVSDSVNNNVQKFTSSGTFITSWNSWNNTNVLKNPLGIAVNSTGFVYVVDQGDQRVQIFRNNGTYVGSIGGPGATFGKFLTPYGVAVDSSGFVYVSDNAPKSGNITKFTKTGGFVLAWGGVNSGGTLAGPAMMIVDNASNIFVSDLSFNRVQKFDTSTGNLLLTWGSPGASPGQFNSPVGVALDGQSNVYIGDSNNYRVQKFSANTGNYISSLTYPRLGLFSSPYDAAMDGSGHIYVVDQGNNRIQMFSVTGTFQLAWGTTGSGNGQFDGPFGIAVDHSGNVYVTDSDPNDRIEKFLPNGTFIRAWGSFGISNGQFYNPSTCMSAIQATTAFRNSRVRAGFW